MSDLKKLKKGMMQIALCVKKSMAFFISCPCTALLPTALNFTSVFCRLSLSRSASTMLLKQKQENATLYFQKNLPNCIRWILAFDLMFL